MSCSINTSQHQLGACWRSNMLLGLLGSIFHTYVSRYITFTHNLILYIGLVSQEWMDGVHWVQMTTSKLGRCFQLELSFAAGPVGLGFSCFKICIFSHNIPFYKHWRMQEWLDISTVILDNSESPPFKFTFPAFPGGTTHGMQIIIILKEGLALLGYVYSIQRHNKKYGAEAKPPP